MPYSHAYYKALCLNPLLSGEWLEEGTTGNDVLEGLHIMLQEILAEEYTEPDNVWPSRRWNKEGTDCIDLSE